MPNKKKPTREQYVKAARRQYRIPGSIEIDNDAKATNSIGDAVSLVIGDNNHGAWVEAKVFVYTADVPHLTKDCKCKEPANAKK